MSQNTRQTNAKPHDGRNDGDLRVLSAVTANFEGAMQQLAVVGHHNAALYQQNMAQAQDITVLRNALAMSNQQNEALGNTLAIRDQQVAALSNMLTIREQQGLADDQEIETLRKKIAALEKRNTVLNAENVDVRAGAMPKYTLAERT